jgi:hypothetical protein
LKTFGQLIALHEPYVIMHDAPRLSGQVATMILYFPRTSSRDSKDRLFFLLLKAPPPLLGIAIEPPKNTLSFKSSVK